MDRRAYLRAADLPESLWTSAAFLPARRQTFIGNNKPEDRNEVRASGFGILFRALSASALLARVLLGRDFLPAFRDITARRADAAQVFVEVEIEMAVHDHQRRHARPDKVPGVGAATAEGEGRLGRIDAAVKVAVTAEGNGGATGQTE